MRSIQPSSSDMPSAVAMLERVSAAAASASMGQACGPSAASASASLCAIAISSTTPEVVSTSVTSGIGVEQDEAPAASRQRLAGGDQVADADRGEEGHPGHVEQDAALAARERRQRQRDLFSTRNVELAVEDDLGGAARVVEDGDLHAVVPFGPLRCGSAQAFARKQCFAARPSAASRLPPKIKF